tara:strand:- start:350 stop:880 length:531 start_codon:yes stop_codon:yes gene_type:complete
MARKAVSSSFETQVQMGLGEALLRLLQVEQGASFGLGERETLLAERTLIIEALNQQYQLNLGFDCNMDGVPDTVEIFMQSAKTSCCRILPTQSQKSSLGDDLAARGGGISPSETTTKKEPPKKAAPKKAAPKKAAAKTTTAKATAKKTPAPRKAATSEAAPKKTSRSRKSRSRKNK